MDTTDRFTGGLSATHFRIAILTAYLLLGGSACDQTPSPPTSTPFPQESIVFVNRAKPGVVAFDPRQKSDYIFINLEDQHWGLSYSTMLPDQHEIFTAAHKEPSWPLYQLSARTGKLNEVTSFREEHSVRAVAAVAQTPELFATGVRPTSDTSSNQQASRAFLAQIDTESAQAKYSSLECPSGNNSPQHLGVSPDGSWGGCRFVAR